MKGRILFQEEQKFVGTWSWYLIVGVTTISMLSLIAVILFNKNTNDAWIGLVIMIVVMGAVLAFFAVTRLYLVVDDQAIYYRFPPFISKERRLGKEDIRSMEIRTFSAIWEYGGYGYRYRLRSGKAFIIDGDMGLQLVLINNKRLLIGTKHPDALERAIHQVKDNWQNDQKNG